MLGTGLLPSLRQAPGEAAQPEEHGAVVQQDVAPPESRRRSQLPEMRASGQATGQLVLRTALLPSARQAPSEAELPEA